MTVTGMYFPEFKVKSEASETTKGKKPPSPLTPPGAGDPTSYDYLYQKHGFDGSARALAVTAGIKLTSREAPARISFGAGGGVAQWTNPRYYGVNEYGYATWFGAPLNQWLPNPPISIQSDSSAESESKAYGTAAMTLRVMLSIGESLSLGLDGRYYVIFSEGESVSLVVPSARLAWRFGASEGGSSYRGYEEDEYRPPPRKRTREEDGRGRRRPRPRDTDSYKDPFIIH
jgi:hypothetical protein